MICHEDLVQLKSWLATGDVVDEIQFTTPAHQLLESLYPSRKDIESLIPSCKHREKQSKLQELDIELGHPAGFDFYANKVLPAFDRVADQGLFKSSGSIEPTFYNPYTKNGRVTKRNARGSELYDKTGLATQYISRHSDGRLLELDYDAHHLRLISSQIGFTAPETSFHRYLAQFYYDSEYDYKEAKQVTFQVMYGRSNPDFEAIPFFKLLSKFKSELWSEYLANGYVICPRSGRQIKANVKDIGQLLNYYICSLETAENAETILNLSQVPVMYSYDSFLFDVDSSTTAESLAAELPHPVTIKSGLNFHELRTAE